MSFKKAEKKGILARIANCGPSGSGKTYWSLEQADRLATAYGTKIAVIDTEYGSAKIYADKFEFDVLELYDDFSPQRYIDAMKDAAKAGYGVVVIDSLTHAWDGTGGVLEKQADATEASKSKNSYIAWSKVTPLQNALRNALLEYPGHLIATMRSKAEYVQQKSERGKTTIEKVGMAPIQKGGLEHEFTIANEINVGHVLCVSGKSRCHLITDKVYRIGDIDKMMDPFIKWLGDYDDTIDPKAPDMSMGKATIGEGQDEPPDIPPMEVLIPQLKTAIKFMSDNDIDGFSNGKRRTNSMVKWLKSKEYAIIEQLDIHVVYEYIEHLRAKCKAHKESK